MSQSYDRVGKLSALDPKIKPKSEPNEKHEGAQQYVRSLETQKPGFAMQPLITCTVQFQSLSVLYLYCLNTGLVCLPGGANENSAD